MVRIWPLGPIAPIGFPLSEIRIPPALPTRMTTELPAAAVRLSLACRVPEKRYFPSPWAETHTGSSAVISTRTAASEEAEGDAAGLLPAAVGAVLDANGWPPGVLASGVPLVGATPFASLSGAVFRSAAAFVSEVAPGLASGELAGS